MKGQVKSENGCCSSVGDLEKHEKFKKLSKEKRIAKLQEVYDKYGVRSNEFFAQVKPFIMWTVYRYLRGMSYTFLEDLVNNAYEELVIAFDGGWTTYYNKPVYKKRQYGTEEYHEKYNNIGEFIMYVVGSSVAKYRSRTFRKWNKHEDSEQDVSEKLNYTDFEMKNNLNYELKEPEDTKYFTKFKFNDNFNRHLEMLKETQPRNNVLYNFMIWSNRI